MSAQHQSASSPTSAAREPSAAPEALVNNPIDVTGSGSEHQAHSSGLPSNPWFAIMARAPAFEMGITHTSLGSLPKPLVPPDGLTIKQQVHYYTNAIDIEQDYQLCILPCILTVDPKITDISYLNIRRLTYERWGERVSRMILTTNDPTLRIHREVRAVPPTPEDLRKSDVQLNRIFDFTRELLEKRSEEYAALVQSNLVKEDRCDRQIIMIAKMVLPVLKQWTTEWEQERENLERAYFQKSGSPRPVRAGTPVLPSGSKGVPLF